MVDQLSKLAEFGAVGISLALIGLFAYMGKAIIKMASNHIFHNTEALMELTKTIAELKTYLREKNGS